MTAFGKEGPPTPGRHFAISPKTPHEWLMKHRGNEMMDSKNREIITSNIITNIIELADFEPDEKILSDLRALLMGTHLKVGGSGAMQTAAIGFNMGLSMDSPEMVYMNGYFAVKELGKKREILRNNLDNKENRKFVTEDARQQKFADEEKSYRAYTEFLKHLEPGIEEYGQQHIPDENFRTVLAVIPFLIYVGTRNTKRETIYKMAREAREGKGDDKIKITQEILNIIRTIPALDYYLPR